MMSRNKVLSSNVVLNKQQKDEEQRVRGSGGVREREPPAKLTSPASVISISRL